MRKERSLYGILAFIDSIRGSNSSNEAFFMTESRGYQFHLLLGTFFPMSRPFISKDKNHIITKYAGKYYDIRGEVSGKGYTPMTENDIEI